MACHYRVSRIVKEFMRPLRDIVSEENLAAIRKRDGQYLTGTPQKEALPLIQSDSSFFRPLKPRANHTARLAAQKTRIPARAPNPRSSRPLDPLCFEQCGLRVFCFR